MLWKDSFLPTLLTSSGETEAAMKNANINVDKSDSLEKTHLEIEEFHGGLTSRGHEELLWRQRSQRGSSGVSVPPEEKGSTWAKSSSKVPIISTDCKKPLGEAWMSNFQQSKIKWGDSDLVTCEIFILSLLWWTTAVSPSWCVSPGPLGEARTPVTAASPSLVAWWFWWHSRSFFPTCWISGRVLRFLVLV